MILAVAFFHIGNNPSAIDIVKVYVNIRHRYAFGIEKPLKKKCIFKRVNIGNAKQVGYDASGCRSAPGADSDTVIPRIVDKIPNDEKVAGVPHPTDDIQLIGKALINLSIYLWITHWQAFFAETF